MSFSSPFAVGVPLVSSRELASLIFDFVPISSVVVRNVNEQYSVCSVVPHTLTFSALLQATKQMGESSQSQKIAVFLAAWIEVSLSCSRSSCAPCGCHERGCEITRTLSDVSEGRAPMDAIDTHVVPSDLLPLPTVHTRCCPALPFLFPPTRSIRVVCVARAQRSSRASRRA